MCRKRNGEKKITRTSFYVTSLVLLALHLRNVVKESIFPAEEFCILL